MRLRGVAWRAVLVAAAALPSAGCQPDASCAEIASPQMPGVAAPPPTGAAPANTLLWVKGPFGSGPVQLEGPGGLVTASELPLSSALTDTQLAQRFRPSRPLEPGRWKVRPLSPEGGPDSLGEFSVDARTDLEPPGKVEIVSVESSGEDEDSLCPAGDLVSIALSAATDDATPTDHLVHALYLAEEPGAQDLAAPSLLLFPGQRAFRRTMPAVAYLVVRAIDAAGHEGPPSEEWRVVTRRAGQGPFGCATGGAGGASFALAGLGWAAFFRRLGGGGPRPGGGAGPNRPD